MAASRAAPRDCPWPRLAGSREGGLIGLVQEGDPIGIDIPNRSIRLDVADDELTGAGTPWRRWARRPGGPASASGKVSTALRAYAAMTTSAAKGAVRVVPR